MLKPIALVTSAVLLFTGCHSKSPTWQKVMAAPKVTGDAEDRDRAYAAELHRHLGATPHKVVTYEVDYFSKLRGSQTLQRTAVLYFDSANQRQPWWVMDHEVDKPVWVPNEPLPRQVSFFARRPVRIVEVHDYTVARDKVVRRVERDTRPTATTSLQRVEATRAVRVEESRAPKRKWRWFGRPAEPKESAVTRREPAVTRLQPATETTPPKAKVRQAAPRQEKKSTPPKPSAPKRTAKPAAEEPAQPEAGKPAEPATGEKPAPAEETPKRPALINREEADAAPGTAPVAPPNLDDAANQPRRPNLFQRIFGTLNPARWFRKAA